ncbi:hypothetical protein TRSC58_07256 [Trypanosoma rangeli SC58]|uniref:Uncharacterized protein n=1 Tax=Trypanosoma rangeli SC58 TaxID=429131 RepID=A0A061IRR1_TRYRA|nr:hypothetical protein TRSC58_07256 [Trypanosoma rangeli SC58]
MKRIFSFCVCRLADDSGGFVFVFYRFIAAFSCRSAFFFFFMPRSGSMVCDIALFFFFAALHHHGLLPGIEQSFVSVPEKVHLQGCISAVRELEEEEEEKEKETRTTEMANGNQCSLVMQESRSFAEVVARGASTLPAELGGGVAFDLCATTDATPPLGCPTESAPFGGAGPLSRVRPPGGESYAEAVMSRSVKLGGVPVNVEKVLGWVESQTNSTLQEQESVLSSWADDDQCFFDSIRIAHEEAEKTKATERPQQGRGNNQSEGGFKQKRVRRGWRFIGGGESSNNSGGRRRGPHSNNNNGKHKYYNALQKMGGTEPPNLTGGRFASLR